jgi:hypothetical protein
MSVSVRVSRSRSTPSDRDAYLTWIKRELSVSLVRGNARLLLFRRFVGVLTRGVGQRYVEGMDVPVLE